MKQRLMAGVLIGGLMAAMVPGVASAAPSADKKGPIFVVSVSCVTGNIGWALALRGPAGWVQHEMPSGLALGKCDTWTKSIEKQ